MVIYTPYFYIIQDVDNGRYYAGARWKQGCHPSELLKTDGYTTSSTRVNKLIMKHGTERFTIRKIKTFDEAIDAQLYEVRFLKKVKAGSNPRFYNGHDGDLLLPFGTAGYTAYMIDTYGVPFFSQHPEFKNRISDTQRKKYGSPFYSQTRQYKQRVKITSMQKYGVEHHLMSREVQQKRHNTNMTRYGVEHPLQSRQIYGKVVDSVKVRYGENITNVSQADKVKKQKADTNKRNRGVDNPSKDPLIKERKRLRQLEKSNRECVVKLRGLLKCHKIPLPKSWYLKPDEYIQSKIMELEEILQSG